MNLNSLFINTVKTRAHLINYQTVRWRRPKKPFWLGIAKSKRFVIPEPKRVLTDFERKQMRVLRSLHDIQMKSLLNFIQNTDPKLENEFHNRDSEGKVKLSPKLEAEISKSFEINNLFNAESARRRDERMKIIKEKTEVKVLREMEVQDSKRKRQMEMLENIVRKEKILSESYVTPENLDETIEKCLNKIDEYDFAIDLQGNRYPGSKSLTPKLDEVKVSEGERASS